MLVNMVKPIGFVPPLNLETRVKISRPEYRVVKNLSPVKKKKKKKYGSGLLKKQNLENLEWLSIIFNFRN